MKRTFRALNVFIVVIAGVIIILGCAVGREANGPHSRYETVSMYRTMSL